MGLSSVRSNQMVAVILLSATIARSSSMHLGCTVRIFSHLPASNTNGIKGCNICRGAKFDVCDPCYGQGKRCLNQKHVLAWRAVPPIQAPENCLAKRTAPSARSCNRCEKKLLQVYLRKLKLDRYLSLCRLTPYRLLRMQRRWLSSMYRLCHGW